MLFDVNHRFPYNQVLFAQQGGYKMEGVSHIWVKNCDKVSIIEVRGFIDAITLTTY